MSNITCTIDCVSGGIQKIKVIKPALNNNHQINNLVDYLQYCRGIEYILVDPPHDVHKEALKIKALYPEIKVEVFDTKIKMVLLKN